MHQKRTSYIGLYIIISSNITGLPEGIEKVEIIRFGYQGINDFGKIRMEWSMPA